MALQISTTVWSISHGLAIYMVLLYAKLWRHCFNLLAADHVVLLQGQWFQVSCLCHWKQRAVRGRLVKFLIWGGSRGRRCFILMYCAVPPVASHASSTTDDEDSGSCRCTSWTTSWELVFWGPATTLPESTKHQDCPTDEHSQHQVAPRAIMCQQCWKHRIWCRKYKHENSDGGHLQGCNTNH